MLCHLSGDLDNFFFSFSRIIYKWGQIFIIISAVQIDIVIRHTVQIFFHRTGKSLRPCPLCISRELPVQIFSIFHTETSRSLFKFIRTDHFHDHYGSCDFFDL